MKNVKLYDYWRSTSSYRVRIALHLKGIEFESIPVDLLAKQHNQAPHLARNPQGLVPVLEIGSQQFTQSLAIIEYLDEVYPEPALLPNDAAERARVRAICQAIAMEIHPVCNLSVVNHVAEISNDEDIKIKWMQHYISKGLIAVEKMLDHPSTGHFCYQDQLTIADCTLIPQLYNAERWGVGYAGLSKIRAIEQACKNIDAFTHAYPKQPRESA